MHLIHDSKQNCLNNKNWQEPKFISHPLLNNAHLMTILPSFLPRNFRKFNATAQEWLIPVAHKTSCLTLCHWQKEMDAPAIILLHGLEGSANSAYILGLAYKAFKSGFNVIRLNMRNCGGSMEHSATLYNGGMHADIHAVMEALNHKCGVKRISLVGYSLGGNMVLNAAATHNSANYSLDSVVAVSPAIDLDAALALIEKSPLKIYERWFLRTLKLKIKEKAKQMPEKYSLKNLGQVGSIRDFDNKYTAIDGGYKNAAEYYREASSITRLKQIKCPSLIIASADDPLVPIQSFQNEVMSNSNIFLLQTEKGGHGGFVQANKEKTPDFDHFWAENRVIAFCSVVYKISLGHV